MPKNRFPITSAAKVILVSCAVIIAMILISYYFPQTKKVGGYVSFIFSAAILYGIEFYKIDMLRNA